MTLETLFARAAQGQTFLRLAVCGLALGALAQGCSALAGRFPAGTPLVSALAAGAALALILPVMCASGDGVRAYGVLGVIVGALLYAAGIAPAAAWVSRRGKKHQKPFRQKQEDPPGAGNCTGTGDGGE